jgi:hypothetical protein
VHRANALQANPELHHKANPALHNNPAAHSKAHNKANPAHSNASWVLVQVLLEVLALLLETALVKAPLLLVPRHLLLVHLPSKVELVDLLYVFDISPM